MYLFCKIDNVKLVYFDDTRLLLFFYFIHF